MQNKSKKIHFSIFTKEEVKEIWKAYSLKTDFSNPISASNYSRSFLKYFSEPTIFKQKFSLDDKRFTRARLHETKNTLLPNIKDLWYPPFEKVWLNRCNLPKQQVFYCSNDLGTTVFEVQPKKGDWITTMEIKLDKGPLEISIIGANTMSITAFNKLEEKDKGINLFFEDIFCEIITRGEDYKYYKTALITCHLLKNRYALAYPSNRSNGKGMNVVFTKEFIDQYAYFKQATVIEIVEIKSEYDIRVRCLYSATKLNQFGDLIWARVNDCRVHTINEDIYHR